MMPHTPPTPILCTQAGCAESANVRVWLVAHGIPFTERNASVDVEAARTLVATGTFATPLVIVGEERVLGYQPEALARALPVIRPPPQQPW